MAEPQFPGLSRGLQIFRPLGGQGRPEGASKAARPTALRTAESDAEIIADNARHNMTTAESPADPNGATFRSHRVLPYPPESVFEAFARPELLARWWGPAGFTNTFEVFEFRPGGHWTFVMHGPDGTHHPNESVFVELQAPSRLVIRHVAPPHFVLTVTLEAQEAGTAITWSQMFEDAAVAARIRHIVEPANEQNLDRLQAVLAGADPSVPYT
jgi:uncharacterized protein YndB with AHSA1/START domain